MIVELTTKEAKDVYNALGMAIDDLNKDVVIIEQEKKKIANRFKKHLFDVVKGRIKNNYTADVSEIERFRKNLVNIKKIISYDIF